MIKAGGAGDSEFGAAHGGGEFGDEFFESIGPVAKARAFFAVETGFGTRPVGQFVKDGAVKGFLRGCGWRADEVTCLGDLDVIGQAVVISARVAIADVGIGGANGVFCGADALEQGLRALGGFWRFIAINLCGVENPGWFCEEAAVWIVSVSSLGSGHERAFYAPLA